MQNTWYTGPTGQHEVDYTDEAYYDDRGLPYFFRHSYAPPKAQCNAESNYDIHMNTTDATRFSHVYVRITPNNVKHTFHTHHR